MTDHAWTVARRAHGAVDKALWIVLAAFVLFFAIFVAPRIADNRATQEQLRGQQAAALYSDTCESLGKPAGTEARSTCVVLLQKFRTRVEQSFIEDIAF
jgi:hypothetical protein